MKKIYLIAFLGTLFSCQKETTPQYQSVNKEVLMTNGSTMLLGRTSLSNLGNAPYRYWYEKNRDAYEPDTNVVNEIKKFKDYKLIIYGGTWCGDTRRDLPKMGKVMSQLRIRTNKYELYMVDNSANENYKQSPDKTVYANSIFRVPTFIVERDGKEIGRIIEDPRESFEKDLLNILEGNDYQPSYALVNEVQKYVNSGSLELLKEPQAIQKFNSLKENSGGLNSLGYMMVYKKDLEKALAIFELNTVLFPEDANTYDSLGEAHFIDGNEKLSKKYYQMALNLDPELESAKEMLLKM